MPWTYICEKTDVYVTRTFLFVGGGGGGQWSRRWGDRLLVHISNQLKTSEHNHSMSNFGPFFFFHPNELNFCMWSPI